MKHVSTQKRSTPFKLLTAKMMYNSVRVSWIVKMEERLIDVSRTTEANVSHITNHIFVDKEKKWEEPAVGERQRARAR